MKILLFFLSTTCLATNWVRQNDLKTVYVSSSACGPSCLCIDCGTGVVPDLDIMKVHNGQLVEDAIKKQEKADEATSMDLKVSAEEARKERLKDSQSVVDASSLSRELKDILKDLLSQYK